MYARGAGHREASCTRARALFEGPSRAEGLAGDRRGLARDREARPRTERGAVEEATEAQRRRARARRLARACGLVGVLAKAPCFGPAFPREPSPTQAGRGICTIPKDEKGLARARRRDLHKRKGPRKGPFRGAMKGHLTRGRHKRLATLREQVPVKEALQGAVKEAWQGAAQGAVRGPVQGGWSRSCARTRGVSQEPPPGPARDASQRPVRGQGPHFKALRGRGPSRLGTDRPVSGPDLWAGRPLRGRGSSQRARGHDAPRRQSSCGISCLPTGIDAGLETRLAVSCELKVLIFFAASFATASKSAGDSNPARLKAHAVLARFCEVNVDSFLSASKATASNSNGESAPHRAKAHAVFASSCALKLAIFKEASRSISSNRKGASTLPLAKAQAVLERSCALKSPTCFVALNAIASNSAGASTPAFAKAHAVFAKACELNAGIFFVLSSAKASNNKGAATLAVA